MDFLQSGTVSQTMKPLNKCMKYLLKLMKPFMPEPAFEPLKLSETDVLIEDDPVSIYSLTGLKGNILHTPGHSADSISLVLENGHAFVGDVVMNLPLCGLKKRPFLLESETLVRESWKILLSAGAKNFHPAHGKAFSYKRLNTRIIK